MLMNAQQKALTIEEELSNQVGRTGPADTSLHLSSPWCWCNECVNTVAMEAESGKEEQARARLCGEKAGRVKVP